MKLFDVYPLFDINIVKGKGCYTYDDQGNTYLDLYGGHAVISVGHSHPHYIKRISDQVENLGFYSNSVVNRLQEEFAEKLGKASGYEDYRLFLVNSGAEANENALKLASFHTGRKKVLSFHKSFHGRTSAAVRVTDNPAIIAPVNQGMDVTFLTIGDNERLEMELKTGDYCAVIIEGILGIGGIIVPDPCFMQNLQNLCKETGTVLILDEIQSGYGRSGRFFAHQYSGIQPDLITVAKGIANGFPMGGLLIAPHFEAKYGMLGTTFGGNHLACAAGLAVLEIMEQEQLVQNAESVGNYLFQELTNMDGIKEVRGLGLMIGLEFDEPVKPIRQKLLFEHHIFTGVSGSNVIRLLPPLCLSMQQATQFIQTLKKVLAEK
ncbi:MAG: aminotransferase class III-fold pyridoxal phosphate-dependent enzyme [Bacteroidales bacterium]|nr:aminotransferase class III-fold pyridoxal phosphate-dependent enzyme [Bacteroidales bacterium]MDD3165821.1 aminotransferase class III-fold pyridoxal phosphate-dependent enzyme [Bacteroidales bacterium]MDD4771093.1 aminotransferase class III-fold pyridoxal phosphate-dependent enzyme [Bacteroidales bacterium]